VISLIVSLPSIEVQAYLWMFKYGNINALDY
jgi:hypothetical protein